MPHSYLKVVGNLGYGCNNSSSRYSVRTTMLSLYTIQKFLRFPLYKISITLLLFLVCLWKGLPQSEYKSTKNPWYGFNYHGLYFDLQVNTPILSPRLWFQLLHKLLFLPSEPTDMWNSVYMEIIFPHFVLFKWTYRFVRLEMLVKLARIEFAFDRNILERA